MGSWACHTGARLVLRGAVRTGQNVRHTPRRHCLRVSAAHWRTPDVIGTVTSVNSVLRNSVKMPRTITIHSPKQGHSLDATLKEAIRILQTHAVPVDATTQIPDGRGRPTASILLQYLDDKSRALRILASAGIHVS